LNKTARQLRASDAAQNMNLSTLIKSRNHAQRKFKRQPPPGDKPVAAQLDVS
jgi:very-short-patch-repair endonuclease